MSQSEVKLALEIDGNSRNMKMAFSKWKIISSCAIGAFVLSLVMSLVFNIAGAIPRFSWFLDTSQGA